MNIEFYLQESVLYFDTAESDLSKTWGFVYLLTCLRPSSPLPQFEEATAMITYSLQNVVSALRCASATIALFACLPISFPSVPRKQKIEDNLTLVGCKN